jgi:hypothetical protein
MLYELNILYVLYFNTFNDPTQDTQLNKHRASLLRKRYRVRGARESVLFIGTQFSILYTFVYSPA